MIQETMPPPLVWVTPNLTTLLDFPARVKRPDDPVIEDSDP